MKLFKLWTSTLLIMLCLLCTVGCSEKPKDINSPPSPETEEEQLISITEKEEIEETDKTTDNIKKEERSEPIKLVDDTVQEEKNVLLEDIESPYQFTRKVTESDIDSYSVVLAFGDGGWQNSEADIHEIMTIVNRLAERDFTEIDPEQVSDWEAYIDQTVGTISLSYDDIHCSFCYKDGKIGLCFSATEELMSENKDFYGNVNWVVNDRELTEFFEKQIEALGGKNGPQLIDITDEEFKVSGDEIGKYTFRTDKDIIIIKINAYNEFEGAINYQTDGSSGSMSKTDEPNTYKILPVFPDDTHRFYGKDLAGYTLTLSSEEGSW